MARLNGYLSDFSESRKDLIPYFHNGQGLFFRKRLNTGFEEEKDFFH